MSETPEIQAFGKEDVGELNRFPASFYIQTDEKSREWIKEILCVWVEKYPQEVIAFAHKMQDWKANARWMKHAKGVDGVNEQGKSQFSIPLAFPEKVGTMMAAVFGKDWLWDKKIYRIFRQEFTLGTLRKTA